MVADIEAPLLGDLGLTGLDGVIDEFLHPPALQTHDVVVVFATIQYLSAALGRSPREFGGLT